MIVGKIYQKMIKKKIHRISYLKFKVRELLYSMRSFFKNTWKFRRELSEFRPYDYSGTLQMIKRSIQLQESWMSKHSNEYKPTLNKKLYYMRRVIYLIDFIMESNFTKLAEDRINRKYIDGNYEFKKLDDGNYELISHLTEEEKENNRLIRLEENKIEKEMWSELFYILNGDEYSNYNLMQSGKSYEDFHTGKGLHTWWN